MYHVKVLLISEPQCRIFLYENIPNLEFDKKIQFNIIYMP